MANGIGGMMGMALPQMLGSMGGQMGGQNRMAQMQQLMQQRQNPQGMLGMMPGMMGLLRRRMQGRQLGRRGRMAVKQNAVRHRRLANQAGGRTVGAASPDSAGALQQLMGRLGGLGPGMLF